jgi:hypothetical protein
LQRPIDKPHGTSAFESEGEMTVRVSSARRFRRAIRGFGALCAVWAGLVAAAEARPASAADAPAAAKSPPAKSKAERDAARKAAAKFLRVTRDDNKQPLAMETSIARFAPADASSGVVVDLIGAVHVADKKYYQALNKKFDEYDVVLYELVAPEGTKIPKGGREKNEHPVAAIQKGMQSILELEFQLEQIDYTKKHLVHADMSPEQFAKSMKDRGESFLQLFFRMMGQALAQQGGKGQVSDAEILFALFSPDRAFQLKKLIALQFEEMGGMLMALDGPQGSTIITERNKVALDVLKKQLAEGKKRIAIFYGAGHLPDMEKRLVSEFKLQPGEVKWVEAWDLRPKKSNGGKNSKANRSGKDK